MKIAERIFKRKDYYITSPFGYRVNPITGETGEFHDGVDYGTNGEKWNQYAIDNGIVLSCGVDTKFNNALFAWIEYKSLGFKLLYYHLDSILVSKGQTVNENTIIGTTGKTGYATGIHLHLGMKYLNSNNYVDPELYDYKVIDIIPVERNKNNHQVEITINNLNARDDANGNKLGQFVPEGIYNILNEKIIDDTRWVEINEGIWCALLEDCYIEYPKSEEIDYKSLYLLSEDKLKRIKDIVNE